MRDSRQGEGALLLELAERCEQAKGPDHELDFAIYAATCGKDTSHIKKSHRYLYGEPVTAAVDAALMLVPNGWRVRDLTDWRDLELSRGWSLELRRVDRKHHAVEADATTPRLALCAAALRARAAEAQTQSV